MLRYYTMDANGDVFLFHENERELMMLDSFGYWVDPVELRREMASNNYPFIYVPIELCRR